MADSRTPENNNDGDLPDTVLADGTQQWYKDGKKHRDGDLPAEIRADGSQLWYQHGKKAPRWRFTGGDMVQRNTTLVPTW